MSQNTSSIHSSTSQPNTSIWSNRFAYILAATGAAVGLGNIWKFPYIMGENGGGAFVIVYLICIALIGIPAMMAEVYIGKKGRHNPLKAAKTLAIDSGGSGSWQILGGMGMLAGFLILSFYAVIAGWAGAYIFKAAAGDFNQATPEQLANLFKQLTTSPTTMILWSSLILIATVFTVAKSLQQGLEKAVRFMMPVMFVLLIIIAGYAVFYGDLAQALHFMFYPDFTKLTVKSVLIALGHAFFTLSLASGVMIMYGAYLPQKTDIVKTSVWIAVIDTLVALIAGIAIFPIVFANGIAPSAGPGLIFQSLPLAFGQMPAGQLFGTLFFIMLVFAAFTSAIALIESSVAWIVDRFKIQRAYAAGISGAILWGLSLLTIFSFSGASWAHFSLLGVEQNFFVLLDNLTSKVLLPLGGAIICIFVGWVVSREQFNAELGLSDKLFNLIYFLIKWIAPIIILCVFLNLIGVVSFS